MMTMPAAVFGQDTATPEQSASPATAQEIPAEALGPSAGGTCERKITDPVKPLNFDMTNEVTGRGLFEALWMGLSPAEFPFKEVTEAKEPCKRGSFKIGRATFTIYGSDRGTPPRWAASTEIPDIMVYLVLMPTPQVAYAAVMERETEKAKANTSAPNTAQNEGAAAGATETFAFAKGATMMHALAVADKKSNRMMYAFFEGIPDDADLARHMCRVLAGQYGIQAALNLETGKYAWGKKIESLTEKLDEKDIARMACQLS